MRPVVFDNIFDAVSDNPEEASELQTRSDLMIAIRAIIEEKGWKQTEAVEHLGLTQPRVSDLVNGRINKFSSDLLMTCLYRLGFRFRSRYEAHQLTMQVQTVGQASQIRKRDEN